jgi:hypothetical protein
MTTELTTINAEISTLEAEGFALAKQWREICKADAKRFTAHTKADGFDTRLGKLMQQLKLEGGERITSQRLKDCGIHVIDKRRRSEALWFVENEIECRQFLAESKKGFTSLTALQAAMKSAKSNVGPNTEGEEKSGGVVTEGDTGMDDAAPTGKPAMSQADVILSLKAMCQANGLNVLDIVDALLAEFTAPADGHTEGMKKSA